MGIGVQHIASLASQTQSGTATCLARVIAIPAYLGNAIIVHGINACIASAIAIIDNVWVLTYCAYCVTADYLAIGVREGSECDSVCTIFAFGYRYIAWHTLQLRCCR